MLIVRKSRDARRGRGGDPSVELSLAAKMYLSGGDLEGVWRGSGGGSPWRRGRDMTRARLEGVWRGSRGGSPWRRGRGMTRAGPRPGRRFCSSRGRLEGV
eukprot:1187721-Prorocentrum_minimum.AAC.1